MFTSSFRFCVIGTSGFGQTRWNTRAEWSSAKWVRLRDLAISLESSEVRPFLALWWFSPAIAYWSGQPGVAGSSHGSLKGIAERARFFGTEDWREARVILENHGVACVRTYDSERVVQNSSAILGLAVPRHARCSILDRTSAQVPPFLIFSAQNPAGSIRLTNKPRKS